MDKFHDKQEMMDLIQEAIQRDNHLGGPLKNNFTLDLTMAHQTLQTPTQTSSQLALILTAVLRRITQIEKKIVAVIIGDIPIPSDQTSHLYRIRMICSELITMLSANLEHIKQSMGQKGLRKQDTARAGRY